MARKKGMGILLLLILALGPGLKADTASSVKSPQHHNKNKAWKGAKLRPGHYHNKFKGPSPAPNSQP